MEFFLHVAYGFGAGVGFCVAFVVSRSLSQLVYGATEDDPDPENE